MTGAAWEVLRDGRGPDAGVVLAVDFRSVARVEAGFDCLARSLPDGHAVWETRTPSPSLSRTPNGQRAGSLHDWWTGGLDGRQVRAVLGYCVGAVHAAAVARTVSDRQPHPPRLLVFDPEPADTAGMQREFSKLVERWGPLLEDGEAERLLADADAAGRSGEPWTLADDLTALAADTAARVFPRAGIDAELGEETVEILDCYLRYLAEAATAPESDWSTAAVLSSSPPGEWARAGHQSVSFNVPHDRLLASPDVADAVRHLLGSTSSEEA
jgi:hypothetical protein